MHGAAAGSAMLGAGFDENTPHRLAKGKQRPYMLPALRIIVVRYGESEFYGWDDRERGKNINGSNPHPGRAQHV